MHGVFSDKKCFIATSSGLKVIFRFWGENCTNLAFENNGSTMMNAVMITSEEGSSSITTSS